MLTFQACKRIYWKLEIGNWDIGTWDFGLKIQIEALNSRLKKIKKGTVFAYFA
jgi:hypothetical protein